MGVGDYFALSVYMFIYIVSSLKTQRLSAAGVIASSDMTRLNAIQRPPTMPDSILSYCKTTDSAEVAARSRIVVATCSTAGYLSGLSLGVGHFTHVVVDEAGQATEPECLLPVALLAGSSGQVGGVVCNDITMELQCYKVLLLFKCLPAPTQ